VIVGDRTSAHQTECTVQRVNWVSIPAPNAPIRAEAQSRYRATPMGATIVPLNDDSSRVKITFDEPQFGITPGQAAVWYDGDLLLGGGIIETEPQSP